MAVLKRRIYRELNKLLAKVNLELVPVSCDFDCRVVTQSILDEMFSNIHRVIYDWVENQKVIDCRSGVDAGDLQRFYQEYLASPFRRRGGTSRLNNLIILFCLSKFSGAQLIIDSGTFQGASAWALWKGSPNAKVISFDIDLSRLVKKFGNIQYIESDWATFDFKKYDAKITLCYFDDHVNQLKRLFEAYDRSFSLLVFDDDFAPSRFAPFAHSGLSLPKIEFLWSDPLKSENSIEWIEKNRLLRIPINQQEMEHARQLIAARSRLPDFSAITGIEQLPYSVVRVRS